MFSFVCVSFSREGSRSSCFFFFQLLQSFFFLTSWKSLKVIKLIKCGRLFGQSCFWSIFNYEKVITIFRFATYPENFPLWVSLFGVQVLFTFNKTGKLNLHFYSLRLENYCAYRQGWIKCKLPLLRFVCEIVRPSRVSHTSWRHSVLVGWQR